MEKLSLGQAIARVRVHKGISQSDLARAVGVTPQAVQKWESGGGPRGARLNAIAQALGVPLTVLLSGEVDEQAAASSGREPAVVQSVLNQQHAIQTALRPVHAIDNPDEAEHEILQVPRYTLQASAGSGAPVLDIDLEGEPNYARRSWARRRGLDPDMLFSIVAVGDSMEPEIHSGDSLIVHRQTLIDDNKLMVICYLGECYVKRVLRQFDGSLIIQSANAAYRDVILSPEQVNELIVVGRVVSITHNA